MTAPIETKAPDAGLPLPPLDIAGHAGPLDHTDPYGGYERIGRLCRDAIVSRLPADWSWEGRSALDFGCGAGRVLRHFAPEADRCELHGCDIDEPAIAWARKHLSPPFNLFLSREMPPLKRPNASFDLIWATSVFTHLVHETWSSWMLELHRLLRPGGILMASYRGERQNWILGEPWDDERIGMIVIKAGLDWHRGGPEVFHSEWWLRAHWGRAFEIVSIEKEGLVGQGLVVMRRRDVTLTPEELDRPEPDEPRELSAAIHQGRRLYAEAAEQRRIARDMTRRVGELARPGDSTLGELQDARNQLAALERKHAWVTQSRIWRMTAPLRRAVSTLRGRARAWPEDGGPPRPRVGDRRLGSRCMSWAPTVGIELTHEPPGLVGHVEGRATPQTSIDAAVASLTCHGVASFPRGSRSTESERPPRLVKRLRGKRFTRRRSTTLTGPRCRILTRIPASRTARSSVAPATCARNSTHEALLAAIPPLARSTTGAAPSPSPSLAGSGSTPSARARPVSAARRASGLAASSAT